MKNILLLNPPYKERVMRDYFCSQITETLYYWLPIDFCIISGKLKNDYNIKCIDAVTGDKDNDYIIEYIRKNDIYAVITLTGYISYAEDIKLINNIKKSNCNIKIIAIGDIMLGCGYELLKREKSIDAALNDITNDDLIYFLNERYDKIENMHYRIDGDIHHNAIVSDRRFTYPVPELDIFNLSKYSLPFSRYNKVIPVLTTYGCKYNCDYCNFTLLPYKEREVDNLFEELDYYNDIGIKEIMFRDNTFGGHSERLKYILEKFIEKKYNFVWSCDLRADMIDEETAILLKKSNCYIVMLGVETFDTDILKEYGKNIHLEKIINSVKLLKNKGIEVLTHIMIGFPDSTKETYKRTLEFVLKTNPDYASFSRVCAFPGTKFREKAEKNIWVNAEDSRYNFAYIEKDIPLDTEDFIKYAYKKFYIRFNSLKKLFKVKTFFQLKNICLNSLELLKKLFIRNEL